MLGAAPPPSVHGRLGGRSFLPEGVSVSALTQLSVGLQEYAADGLRTLVLAYRDLTEDEWEAWSESHHCADRATSCREDRLAAAYEEIEQDMMVGGLILGPLICPPPVFPHVPDCSMSSSWGPRRSRTSCRKVSRRPSPSSPWLTSRSGFSLGTSRVRCVNARAVGSSRVAAE